MKTALPLATLALAAFALASQARAEQAKPFDVAARTGPETGVAAQVAVVAPPAKLQATPIVIEVLGFGFSDEAEVSKSAPPPSKPAGRR